MDSANSSDLIAKVLYNLTTGETEAYLGKSPDAVDKDDAKYYSCGMKATASLFADKKEAAGFVSMFNREELLHQFSIGCNHFSYDYKRFARTGDVFWANTQCTLFSEPESDDVMCFLYTYDIDEQKTTSDMVNAVVWMDYDYIGLLDCRSKRFSIRSKSSEDSGETPIHSYEDYDSNMAMFMRKNVVPEMQDAAINDMCISNITAELKKSGSFTCFLPLLHPGGRISRKKLRFSYLDEFNERVLITQLDITDVYLQEQERVKELNDAAKALEKANNAKTDFLSRMSHDLRTPMNAIVGLSELAINNVYDEATMSEYISDINSAGKFLLGLVNDCLDTEKLAAGKMVLAPEPYPYSRFHANLKTMIEPLCKKKNIEFHFVDSKHQPLVYMDPVRMEQIFMNLLTNAVKFTPEGGKVEFNINSGGNTADIIHCDFIVKDNGVGISEEFQQRMFEPFEQEEGSYASGSQGTGLGLSIVKSLVDLMGGTIDVISKKGVGSRFTVHLDMPVSNEAEAEMYNYPDNDDGHSLSGRRILLAEDHPLNAKIAVNLLESRSVKVYCASNGKECLDMFAGSAPGYYDAILMDIRMPVMDGLTAAASIRSLDRKDAAYVPIIAMTANAFDEDVKATRDAGMNQHLSKPIHPVKLYMSLEYWIEKYRG
ncbi:MAG: ATP-binding protein [Eubacteriaceae bacterium]|nr:ATP-binding protein [Eubacteriaceae bacterium]